MKSISTLKKIALCLIIISGGASASAQTAIWTGSNSTDWNDATNWIWSDGSSGIPGAANDIILTDTSGFQIIVTNETVSCKNILFSQPNGGSYPIIHFDVNGILEVYGNIQGEDDFTFGGLMANGGVFDPSNGIIFKGNTEQIIHNTQIFVGKVVIDKTGGNVTSGQNTYLVAVDSLLLKSNPVAIGSEAVGNLIVDGTLMFIYTYTFIGLPNTDDSEIPPHIISDTLYNKDTVFPNGLLVFNFSNQEGLNTIQIPIGANKSSYTPVSITDSSGLYVWSVAIQHGLEPTCSGNSFVVGDAVQNIYQILPYNEDIGGYTPVYTIPNGINASFSFNKSNIGQDVPAGFNSSNDPIQLWHESQNNCYNEIEGATQIVSGNVTTVTVTDLTNFTKPAFVLSPQATGTNGINEIAKTIGFRMYPNPVNDEMNIAIDNKHPALEMIITDAFGRKIITKSYAANSLLQGKQVEVSQLSSGIYFIHFTGIDMDFNAKFVKK